MRLPAATSALALAAALAAAPALAASPGSASGSAPGTGNPSNGPAQGAATQPGSGTSGGPGRGGNPATEAGAAGTSAITNPAALGTAPNPGPRPGAPTQGSTASPPAGTNGVTAPGNPTNSAAQNATPPQRNPVLTKGGRVRASRVIGSAVYDGHDQKIGTIDDILLGVGDHQAGDQQPGDQHGAIAVISVGGFLGIGSKLVAVPYSKLQFGNINTNSDNRVVMPGATKAALGGMPSYHYRPGNA